MTEEYKALSIRQPWTWLIVHGHKDIENRTWRTDYRGPLYIHASKTFDVDGWRIVKLRFPNIALPNRAGFNYGAVIGRVQLTNIVQHSENVWFEGPYGWVLNNPEVYKPQWIRGKLGLFTIKREDER